MISGVDERRDLYFEDSQGNLILVAEEIWQEEIMENIDDFLVKHFPNFKLYYMRAWEETPGDWTLDYGSHTTFFYRKRNK